MSQNDSWRISPIYTFSEAARLAKTTPGTIKRWIVGTKTSIPLFEPAHLDERDPAVVSFVQLVEVVVASSFRRKGNVSLEVVRQAHHNARNHLGVEYPFASLKLEPLAGHIILRLRQDKLEKGLPAIDSLGLSTIPGLTIEVLDDLEYETELATRWWPVGKQRPIVIDPRFSAGLPTIPQRRVTIQNIRKRWLAGQTIQFISKDLELEDMTVEDALRYSEQIAA